jgi:hypothetical protein
MLWVLPEEVVHPVVPIEDLRESSEEDPGLD